MLVLLPLLYRRLRRPLNDFRFVAIGFSLNMLYFLLLVLVPSPAAAFGTIPLNALSQVAYPHLRSIFSLAIAQDSQGQLFAALSAVIVHSSLPPPTSSLSASLPPSLLSQLLATSLSPSFPPSPLSSCPQMETLMTALTPLVLNSIYNATVREFPQCVWLVLVFNLIAAEGCLYGAYRGMKMEGGREGEAKKEEGALLILAGEEEGEEEERKVGV